MTTMPTRRAENAETDVMVLGAGIVGVSTALHLQQRAQNVLLIDKARPGSGTSHGNAGLIERASVIPYAMPHSPWALLRYADNRQPDVRFQWRALPQLAPWLWRYWRESAPARLARAAQDMLPLIQRCVSEHAPLVQAAGLQSLIRQCGWMDVYRHPAAFAEAAATAQQLKNTHDLRADVLDIVALQRREPGLLPQAGMAGAIHWLDPWSVRSPGALVEGYAKLFQQRGGTLIQTDARALEPGERCWRLHTPTGTLHARHVVIALGPDTLDISEALGYRLPLIHKRGYHLHFRPEAGQALPHVPLCDSQAGFVLSSMSDGVRLTTGVSLTLPDAPPDTAQLQQAESIARTFWPLGSPVEAEPWMGRRPCTPDMRPIIGPATHHPRLWFNVGHAHHGLTLGPATGRLLAEMITGDGPFTNPAPYSPSRFNA
ncbi:MAG: FAD-binding oxidoreductase [Lautropia sp.]|nr:FAD-binding oxidoreductase [Lautropia sp.]